MKKLVIILVLLLGIVILSPAQKITVHNGKFLLSDVPDKDVPAFNKLHKATRTIAFYQKMIREKSNIRPEFFCEDIKDYGVVKKVKDPQTGTRIEKFCRFSAGKSLQFALADFDKVLRECHNGCLGYYMIWCKLKALERLSRAEKRYLQDVENVLLKLCHK